MSIRNTDGDRIATKNGTPCKMITIGEVDGVEVQVNSFHIKKNYHKKSEDMFLKMAKTKLTYNNTRTRLLAKLEAKRSVS